MSHQYQIGSQLRLDLPRLDFCFRRRRGIGNDLPRFFFSDVRICCLGDLIHWRHRAARSRNRTQRVRAISTSGVSQKPK